MARRKRIARHAPLRAAHGAPVVERLATPPLTADVLDAQPVAVVPREAPAATTGFPAAPTRAQIERLEAEMRQFEPLLIEPVHHFAEGLYAREITIPAGTLLTGKVHRTEHLNIVSKGRITVWTEDGMRTVEAPCTLVSRPGTKRVGFAHTETVWTTIHANPGDETDLDALEARLIEAPALDAPTQAPALADATGAETQR